MESVGTPFLWIGFVPFVLAIIERRPPVVGGVHGRKGHLKIVAQGELHHP